MGNLFIKANNRSNGIVNRHLQETVANSFECFEDTVRSRKYVARWDIELEIKIEELYRVGVYEPIYELLLKNNGSVEKWAKLLGNRYNIDRCELFSDFQLHLFNMLDGIADKAYNNNISFMNNLYKQLECLAKDKRKYYNANKRKYDRNFVSKRRLEQVPDIKNEYADSKFLMDLQNLSGISPEDMNVLVGLATGQICRKDIPTILNWTNKDDRMKLSRYVKALLNKLQSVITLT
ncbi:hypothetical protein [Clostridium scatologenes]|uniref:Uncharacterized protein n=1 Tax=Clostridium scatologenes TaxID=1548 RepID=A0A0E3K409_CLOSL|nr:hypothetical protein [Clostridium scatologenes]AKA72045.1 hypothetical protein CSCA_4920 [Clostridium scatologenes]